MKKLFFIVVIWALILGGGAVAYKYLVLDHGDGPVVDNTKDKDSPTDRDKDKTPDKDKKDGNVVPTDKDKDGGLHPSGPKIKLALDSFSGYCIFRSDEFKKKLADQKLDYEWVDDNADYPARMKTVQSGETPLAVFTIDALINNTPPDGDPPATILMVIDETRGADAMVGLAPGTPEVDAMNRADQKIVLVEGSPSETLARVVRSQFKLPDLPLLKTDYLIPAKDAKIEDVYEQFKNASPADHTAFVLWEPFVSKALQRKEARLLIDSSQFKGYIVDVLVAQRDWLLAHPSEAKAVVETYLEMLHARQQTMAEAVLSDADVIHQNMSPDEAAKIAKGIWWKNTLENYAHFGVLPQDQSKGLQRLDEMIHNITTVLDQTKQPGEPTPGPGAAREERLYDARVLQQLYGQRPSFQIGKETIREEPVAGPLTDDQWNKLSRVGLFKVDSIQFKRGKADFSEVDQAETTLGAVAEKMQRWPQYYLRVEGNTLGDDNDENRQLVKSRAETVRSYLVDKLGMAAQRVKAVGNPAGRGKEVDFVMLQAR